MYTNGQEVWVQIGNSWEKGEILRHYAGFYRVWLFEKETVGWYYCDSVMPNHQLEIGV